MKQTRGQREEEARGQRIMLMYLRAQGVRHQKLRNPNHDFSQGLFDTDQGKWLQTLLKPFGKWYGEIYQDLRARGMTSTTASDLAIAIVTDTILSSKVFASKKAITKRFKIPKDWKQFSFEATLFRGLLPALRTEVMRQKKENKKFTSWDKTSRRRATYDDTGIYKVVAKELYGSDSKQTLARLRKKIERMRKQGYLFE